MAYNSKMAAAARRHLLAADALPEASRGVAGYLYGIAAECAVKAMMLDAGIRLTDSPRKGNPTYAHFPMLRTLLADRVGGRSAQILAGFVRDESFMREWAIDMRYCDGKQIKAIRVKEWSNQARSAVGAIGT